MVLTRLAVFVTLGFFCGAYADGVTQDDREKGESLDEGFSFRHEETAGSRAHDNEELHQHFQSSLLGGEVVDEYAFEASLTLSQNRIQGEVAHIGRREAANVKKVDKDSNCAVDKGELDYFDIEISLVPQTTSENCKAADRIMLGHDINRILMEVGVAAEAGNDNVFFLAGVCPKPAGAIEKKRALKWQKKKTMRPSGFIYTGIGGCHYCPPDNKDQRMLVSDWFETVFKPQTEQQVKDAIKTELIPKHTDCLGTNPTIVVDIIGMELADLEAPCKKDKGHVGSLKTFNLGDTLIKPESPKCRACVNVDFSKSGNEAILKKGQYVSSEWKGKYGLTITTTGGYAPDGKSARVLDTSSPDARRNKDTDLGSPNRKCSGGGPGKGLAGRPGKPGENCQPIGNVLIIQESGSNVNSMPIPLTGKGTFAFDFDEAVLFSDIGMLDVKDEKHTMAITYEGGTKETYSYLGYGDNAVQRIVANKPNVKRIEMTLASSGGAVTELNFCPPCK